MNAQLKKGVLELVVLSEISKSDMYGYLLSQNIARVMSIADGSLYPLLRKLVKQGYLKTYLGKDSGGPARKYYSITDLGREHLIELTGEWKSLKQAVDHFI